MDLSLDELVKQQKSERKQRPTKGRGGSNNKNNNRNNAPRGVRGGGVAKARNAGRNNNNNNNNNNRNRNANTNSRRGSQPVTIVRQVGVSQVRGSGSVRGGRGRGARGGRGGVAFRQPRQPMPDVWQHDMYSGPVAGDLRGSMAAGRIALPGASAIALSTGAVVEVTNLDTNVSQNDMKELFETVGPLKKVTVTMQNNSCSAEVTFQKKSDATAAVKKYNGVLLDGKAMKMSIKKPSASERLSAAGVAAAAGGRAAQGNGRMSGRLGGNQDVKFTITM